LWYGRTYNVW